MKTQFYKTTHAVVQFDADVARIFKNAILLRPEYDRFTRINLTADAEMNLHLGKNLLKHKIKLIAATVAVFID